VAGAGEDGAIVSWPDSLVADKDGCAEAQLVRGYVPAKLRFDPERWVALTLDR
jgi:hypothetical protein